MIADEITKVTYKGDGTTKSFPFSFHYDDVADVKAIIYDTETGVETEITSDYYIDTSAGTYNYPGYAPGQEASETEQPPVLTETKKIVIYRDTPETQLIDMGDKYPLPTIESTVDKLTMIVQEHNEKLERSVKVPLAVDMEPDELLNDIYEKATIADACAKISEAKAEEAQAAAETAAEKAYSDYETIIKGDVTDAQNAANTAENFAVAEDKFTHEGQDYYSSKWWASQSKEIAFPDGFIEKEKLTDNALLYLQKDYVTPQMYKTDSNTWSDAFQSAVDNGNLVIIPNGTYDLDTTINVPAGVIIKGLNKQYCIVNSSADVAFKYQAPAGSGEYIAPCYSNFRLNCAKSGIQYNDESLDCIDGASAQQGYVMRPYISEMIIQGTNGSAFVDGSYGIHCVKCFNGVIEKCRIGYFDSDIRFYGTDNTSIHDNRIVTANALIDVVAKNTFGSQTWIYNNDLLDQIQYAVKTSSRNIYIHHNYFEKYDTDSVFVYWYGGNGLELCSNKVDNASSTAKLISVEAENYSHLKITDNWSTGASFPKTVFETDGSRAFETNSLMEKKSVEISNNYQTMNFTRGTVYGNDSYVNELKYPSFVFYADVTNIYAETMNTYNLMLFDYDNQAIELKGNGGVSASVYRIPCLCGSKKVKVTVKAKAKNADSASLFYQTRSSTSYVMNSNTVTLTNEWQEYTLYTSAQNLNYFVVCNSASTDTEDTRPLIKWIKMEEVAE